MKKEPDRPNCAVCGEEISKRVVPNSDIIEGDDRPWFCGMKCFALYREEGFKKATEERKAEKK